MSARCPLPGGGVCFTVTLLGHALAFRRYPLDVAPPEGLVGFVNDASRQCAGIYRDGAWRDAKGRALKWEPTHWTALDEQEEL